EVHPAAVDVECGAQVLHAHGRALDVPPRPAAAPGGVPGDLTGLGGFPEGEVRGVALAGAFERARAGLLLLDATVRELAVIGIAGDVEPDVSVGGVRVAVLDQRLADRDDLRDVLGRFGEAVD